MVYKIIIRLKDKFGNVKVSYDARNLGGFDCQINMPISTFGLPEDYMEAAIITKAEGNQGKVVFSWIIKDETTTPFTAMASWNTLWPSDTTPPHTLTSNTGTFYSRKIRNNAGNSYQSFDLKTADGQMIALAELFEKKGFTGEERHEFLLRNETDSYDIFNEAGLIQRLSFQKSGSDPVTWNASVEFQIGDVVDSTE